jgi:hypothetical protein
MDRSRPDPLMVGMANLEEQVKGHGWFCSPILAQRQVAPWEQMISSVLLVNLKVLFGYLA